MTAFALLPRNRDVMAGNNHNTARLLGPGSVLGMGIVFMSGRKNARRLGFPAPASVLMIVHRVQNRTFKPALAE
jgi:hypothetical protein